ncbi:hypothetical protein [Streptacidiphilus anmyonensis]|uniref:hypothetical protein n=1 Tax=Streptacidiphilus anmyonensis TaxID=405782 RepID=UPI0005A98764|nr:hypothetical protein [Streptacidiphilus anmyonensis]
MAEYTITPTKHVERFNVDHTVVKRLGHWTTADSFEIRARGGAVVLDLRSPELPADLEIHVDLRRASVKLLLPEETEVDHWDVQWTGRGKVKDAEKGTTLPATRRVRLVGAADNSEIRVLRAGVAAVTAIFTREWLDDARRARKEGRLPTLDDPTRNPYADPHRAA